MDIGGHLCYISATSLLHRDSFLVLRPQIPGIDKAKAYMESVPYFLRHGDAIEHERQQQNQQWVESGGEASKRKSFKMYSDTLSVVRYVYVNYVNYLK